MRRVCVLIFALLSSLPAFGDPITIGPEAVLIPDSRYECTLRLRHVASDLNFDTVFILSIRGRLERNGSYERIALFEDISYVSNKGEHELLSTSRFAMDYLKGKSLSIRFSKIGRFEGWEADAALEGLEAALIAEKGKRPDDALFSLMPAEAVVREAQAKIEQVVNGFLSSFMYGYPLELGANEISLSALDRSVDGSVKLEKLDAAYRFSGELLMKAACKVFAKAILCGELDKDLILDRFSHVVRIYASDDLKEENEWMQEILMRRL